ncbi:unnamed protein product, partial [Iphiclides podalirius]
MRTFGTCVMLRRATVAIAAVATTRRGVLRVLEATNVKVERKRLTSLTPCPHSFFVSSPIAPFALRQDAAEGAQG